MVPDWADYLVSKMVLHLEHLMAPLMAPNWGDLMASNLVLHLDL